MADHIIQCPQCQRQVRVPDTMFGRLVKCPLCGMTFTVAAANAPPPAEPPVVETVPAPPAEPGTPAPPPSAVAEYRPADVAVPEPPDTYAEAAAAVKAPGICVLLTGALGLIWNLFNLAQNLLMGQERAQAAGRQFAERMGMQMDPQLMPIAWTFTLVLLGILVLMSFLATLGSLRMLQLRNYGLALVASIASLANFGPCCCPVGLPFGIWALVVLLRPDVRAAFE
jgi:predicted Zn finger-like uncharacterized protein